MFKPNSLDPTLMVDHGAGCIRAALCFFYTLMVCMCVKCMDKIVSYIEYIMLYIGAREFVPM